MSRHAETHTLTNSPWLNIGVRNRWLLNEFSISPKFYLAPNQPRAPPPFSPPASSSSTSSSFTCPLPMYSSSVFPLSPPTVCGDMTAARCVQPDRPVLLLLLRLFLAQCAMLLQPLKPPLLSSPHKRTGTCARARLRAQEGSR